MSAVPSFPEGQIEALARLLGECGSGATITRVLNDRGLVDASAESTKWRRLYLVFLDCQRKHGCANQVIDFIQSFLIPARFVGRSEEFEMRRRELNTILAFSGLDYGADGKFCWCKAVQTLDEAEKRVQTIRAKFQGRRIHPEVLKYCRTELLQDNYFHAVFEATKGLAQRIRDLSGVDADGAALVDRVFSSERPVLAINTLQTETEKTEHKGFAALLKGCFAAIRKSPGARTEDPVGGRRRRSRLPLFNLATTSEAGRVHNYARRRLPMIADLKPYPAMKDSGMPWLGEVPEHWAQMPGVACFQEKKVPNVKMQETTVLSLSYGHIVVKSVEKLHGLVPASFETYQIIDPGDIIVRPTDLQNDWNSLRFGLSHYRGIITSAYLCLLTTKLMTQVYGHLLLHAYDLKKVFYGLGSGLRQNLDWRDFKYLPCLIPPLPEQAAIVRFLDYVDRRIRRYIRVKQKLIKLLEEQKQAIIHRAVTRGLDPTVRLKSSGVEWLGDVPGHWEVKRCRYVFREVDKRSTDGLEEHLSMSQRLGLVPSHLVENRTLVSESYAGGKLCEVGDLVLNRLKAHLGVFALAQFAGVISPDYTVLRPIEPDGAAYFERVLRSPACRGELHIRAKGIVEGFWRLYTNDFYDIRLPVPPDQERRAINDYNHGATTAVDDAVARTEREISLLREYRTRLIADVVTGKLDVREAAARLREEAEAPELLDEANAMNDAEEDTADDIDSSLEEAEG